MNISIIGTGYVGLVTGTCLADFGLNVICVDQDKNKIDILNSGGIPIYEPNLEPLIEKNISAGRLTFTTDLKDTVRKSKVIFIAVGTPPNHDGSADISRVEQVAKEIANLCDKLGADVHQVAKAMGMDGRISPKFLHPGPGFGGSCFPKDTRALNAIADNAQYDFKLIKAVLEVNLRQRQIAVDKIEKALGDLKGKTIAILGLAFKQNTDDIRESPALDIIKILLQKEAIIKCYDPLAMENTKKLFPDLIYCSDEYETARDSDALVILTEWNQFRNLDLLKIKKLLKTPILLDLRNLYDPEKVKALGFHYFGIGRS